MAKRCIKALTAMFLVWLTTLAGDAQPPTKPRRITPGQVIVPLERMRRPWGELISLDLQTRTGKFRQESNDEVVSFTVLPYAELLHHAAFGDLQDFRVGERAIFRLHENEQGKWVWLTYIQDEMNFLFGHKEYYYVDRIDPGKGRLEITQANADRSFVRTKGLFLDTDAQTRYWKQGQPARFTDIKVGDRLRTQTHGVGKGQVRVCWEVFLDDESLLQFQARQRAVHARRMKEEGLPGYVDRSAGKQVELTLFLEAREESRGLKAGQAIRLAPAGVDRKPTRSAVMGTVRAVSMAGNLGKVTVMLDNPGQGFQPAGLARLWPGP
jgi:hypothetical protein